jgi:hypothetical protein
MRKITTVMMIWLIVKLPIFRAIRANNPDIKISVTENLTSINIATMLKNAMTNDIANSVVLVFEASYWTLMILKATRANSPDVKMSDTNALKSANAANTPDMAVNADMNSKAVLMFGFLIVLLIKASRKQPRDKYRRKPQNIDKNYKSF